MSGIKEWYEDNREELHEQYIAENETDFMRWLECEYGSRGTE